MPQIGPLEMLVILVVALMVFGPKELPRLARQAAKAWREVQRFQANVRRDIDEVLHDEEGEDDEPESPSRAPTLPPKQPDHPPGLPPGTEVPPADGTS